MLNDNFPSFDKAYLHALKDVTFFPEFRTSPRGQEIREHIDYAFTICPPENNFFSHPLRPNIIKYLYAELVWYFSTSNKIDFISKHSSFWNHLANEDKEVNSAYGNLLFNSQKHEKNTSWRWAFDSLVKDKDSRQAIIRFNRPLHEYEDNKDFVCTMYGHFFIRDEELHFTVHMRSQDIIFGMTYDVPFFTILMQQMRLHLLPYYPELKLGRYTHIMDSMHLYARHFELAESMCYDQHGFESIMIPQIQTSFVDVNGFMTPEFAALYYVCKSNDLSYVTNDPLFKEIHKNVVTNQISETVHQDVKGS